VRQLLEMQSHELLFTCGFMERNDTIAGDAELQLPPRFVRKKRTIPG
jgi:hypothetical protein